MSFSSTKISELLKKDVNVYYPGDTVSKILGELYETGRYEAIVLSGDKYGLITIRDVLKVNQPQLTKIGESPGNLWMTLLPASPEDEVANTAQILLKNNVRAIPVVESRKVSGLISQVDISNALCEVSELSGLAINELMTKSVVSMKTGEKVARARSIMLEKGFSHIPITDSGRLVGVITASDIVHTFIVPASRSTFGERSGEKVTRFSGEIDRIMDVNPYTVDSDASAKEVACNMRRLKKSAAFVVSKNNSVLGIITPRELISVFFFRRVDEELPVYILGLLDEDDFFEKAVAEDKIRRTVRRGVKMHPRINEVSVNIKRQQRSGKRVRFQMSVRVLTPSEQYIATAEGWEMTKTFNELCETLDKVLSKSKHSEQIFSRRRRRGR